MRRQPGWAFAFWTLRDLDGRAAVKVRMPGGLFDGLETPLRDGERVLVHGRVELFMRTGDVSLRVHAVERAGLGDLLARVERLRLALAAEGLFAADRKRPLPVVPRCIGLVCGRDAAARHDVTEHVTRRFSAARFEIVECAVQGVAAPREIVRALRQIEAGGDADVIVLARGGGSLEDLAAFSDESVCRAIAACAVPVVSAIGHEQDTPLSDLVADARASTPTHAARLVAPDARALVRETAARADRAYRVVATRVARERETLAALRARPVLLRPGGFLDVRRDGIGAARRRLTDAQGRRLELERSGLQAAARQLRALGPAATLDRGYAIALDGAGRVVREAAAVATGDSLSLRLARGRLTTRVEEVEP